MIKQFFANHQKNLSKIAFILMLTLSIFGVAGKSNTVQAGNLQQCTQVIVSYGSALPGGSFATAEACAYCPAGETKVYSNGIAIGCSPTSAGTCYSLGNSCSSPGTCNVGSFTFTTANACTVALNGGGTCYSSDDGCSSSGTCGPLYNWVDRQACTLNLPVSQCFSLASNCGPGNCASTGYTYTTVNACVVALNSKCYSTANACATTSTCNVGGYTYTTLNACVVALNGGGNTCYSLANSCSTNGTCGATGGFIYGTKAACDAAKPGATCTPGQCTATGFRCEIDPLTGKGYVGTHVCTTQTCTADSQCSASEYCSTNCYNKLPNGTACTRGAQCATGTCTGGVCSGSGTNISCTSDATCPSGFLCNQTTHLCSQATGSTSPSPVASSSPACKAAQTSCETGSCCAGFVCQGVAGSRLCQQQNPNDCSATDHCGGNQGYIGFHCNNLTNGQCLENPQTFNSMAEAVTYAGSCGQADTVCAAARNLCGGFTIFSSGCTTPQASNPPASSTPGVTPTPIGPVCLNIAMSKPNPVVGDTVTFTCGTVAGAARYEFRVKLPDGTIQNLATSTTNVNVSTTFTVNSSGAHFAQCRLCTGAAESTCQAYSSI